jgi:hypothetical protein
VRSTFVICPVCRELVQVVDKKLVDHHEGCPASGMYYAPTPMGWKSGAGGPSFEILGARRASVECEGCSETHEGMMVFARATIPNPNVN